MSELDKNKISDEALRQMLQLNMLLAKDDDKQIENLIQMEAKYALTTSAFAGMAIPAEAKLLAKLKTVSGKAIYGKWLFAAIAGIGIGSAAFIGLQSDNSSVNPNKNISSGSGPAPYTELVHDSLLPTDAAPVPEIKPDSFIPTLSIESIPPLESPALPASPTESSPAPLTPHEEVYHRGTLNFDENSQKLDTVFKGIQKLEVNGLFCHINVSRGESDQVKMNGQLNMKGKKDQVNYFIRYERIGNALRISVEKKEKSKNWISWNSTLDGQLSFLVDSKTEVFIKNSSGDIFASGLESPSFSVECAYGNVNVEKMNNNVNIMAGSGDVAIRNITGNVNCLAKYGNQNISDVTGNTNINSNSGNINLSNISGDAMIDAKYGNVDVNLFKGSLNLNSSSGNINLNDVKGEYVRLKCLYGNVSMKNIRSNSEIDSKSGDVSIHQHTGYIFVNTVYGNQSLHKVEGEVRTTSKSGSVNLNEVKGPITIDAFYGSVGLYACRGKISIKASNGEVSGAKVEVEESMNITANYGNIKMDLLNPSADLSFDLNAPIGESKIIMGDLSISKQNGNLIHNGGKIKISSTSSVGNQYFE